MFGKKMKVMTATVLAVALAMSQGTVLQVKGSGDVPAGKIQELKEEKTYSYDLDGDGTQEKLSYELKNNCYRIYVNSKKAQEIKLDDSYYAPVLQIADLDTATPGLDLWAYCYASSDDISYSGLYQYSNQKLKEVFRLEYQKISKNFEVKSGYLSETDGKGNFSIAMDRVFDATNLVGNYYVNIPYQLKNGKVKRVSKNVYKFAAMYSTDSKISSGKFKAAKNIKFYAKPNTKSKTAFTLKKGKIVKAESIYFKNGVTYVKFKASNGKTGYLKGNRSFEGMMFSNMLLAD